MIQRHVNIWRRRPDSPVLSTLTGTQVLLLVVLKTDSVYILITAKLRPSQPEGKNLIRACLNTPRFGSHTLIQFSPYSNPVPHPSNTHANIRGQHLLAAFYHFR